MTTIEKLIYVSKEVEEKGENSPEYQALHDKLSEAIELADELGLLN